MAEANTAGGTRLVQTPPSAQVVQKWIDQAKKLDPGVSYSSQKLGATTGCAAWGREHPGDRRR
ncbi:MAG TPA: hypothetical protein VE569_04350 [Acidimicrobiia bacterium]|nr:hypothetical protein [Acidimicrobiia bacterium]